MATLEFWKLSAVSDDQLLQDLSGLITTGARLEARVVAHLAEVEERRLHLKAATSSLFDYCRRRMGLSESEAFHRITAARLARRFPMIFELLEARAIHLSALRVLRDHLTTENHRELLATASGKSTKEVEVLVAALAPRPDVASRIRKLPVPRCRALASAQVAATGIVSVAPESVAPESVAPESVAPESVAPESVAPGSVREPLRSPIRERSGNPPTPVRRSTGTRAFEPLSPTRYLLRVSISDELKDKVERARDLMSHANPSGELALVLEKALDLLLEKLATQRFAQTKRPRPAREMAQQSASWRAQGGVGVKLEGPRRAAEARAPRGAHREHISNEVRRAVAVRDGGQCTYVDDEGRRCPGRAFLQFHHEHAHALGGLSTLENLRLLCGSHNRLRAERDFGRKHQERFTSRGAQDSSHRFDGSGEGPKGEQHGDAINDEYRPMPPERALETERPPEVRAAP